MTPTRRNPEIKVLSMLDRWKIPFLFIAALAAAVVALPVLRQAAYDTALRPCVEKTVAKSMDPVIGELVEIKKSIRLQTTYLVMSQPQDTLDKYIKLNNQIWGDK
jgi:hypothetical protein